MKIYTRGGDEGETGLIGGRRVSKADLTIDALGDLDELNAMIGFAVASGLGHESQETCLRIQSALFDLGASVAAPNDPRFEANPSQTIQNLEMGIDKMTAELPALNQFILPGGSESASRLHLARTICRRAERSLVKSGHEGGAVAFLNRLSDWLFVAARYENHRAGKEENPWMKSC